MERRVRMKKMETRKRDLRMAPGKVRRRELHHLPPISVIVLFVFLFVFVLNFILFLVV